MPSCTKRRACRAAAKSALAAGFNLGGYTTQAHFLIGNGLDCVLAEWEARKRISRREREIIEQILEGRSNKEIKAELKIAYSTVKNHLYNIYQKLGVNSRAQLIHRLLQERGR